MTIVKRPRGRPTTKPKTPTIHFSRFVCIYANAVAQVYQCVSHDILTDAEEERYKDDPTRLLVAGDCFVLNSGRVQLDGEHAKNYTPLQAIEEADLLWRNADEDARFGTLTGPRKRVVYANWYCEVQFVPDISIMQPFVIVHPVFSKVFVDIRGRRRTFKTLDMAIKAADREAQRIAP